MNQLHWQNNRNTNNYRLLFAHLDNRQLRHVEVSGDVRADHRFRVLGCVFRERFWDINAGIGSRTRNGILSTVRSSVSSWAAVRGHSEGTLNLHHKAAGLQHQSSRKTSCIRILERFLFVE